VRARLGLEGEADHRMARCIGGFVSGARQKLHAAAADHGAPDRLGFGLLHCGGGGWHGKSLAARAADGSRLDLVRPQFTSEF
jgi:hypothetical protein